MPVPLTAPIEGYPNPGSAIATSSFSINPIAFSTSLRSYPQASSWNADSSTLWVFFDEQRPYTWTTPTPPASPFSRD